MKTNRILSTAGINPAQSTRIRSYCYLMQAGLTEKWLFADDFVESHVCFIMEDYLNNIDKEVISKSQVIIVVTLLHKNKLDYEYQISLPITADKVRNVLNQVSIGVNFSPINSTNAKTTIGKFKAAFLKIRLGFFGGEKKAIEKNKKNRKIFLSKLTQKINLQQLVTYKIVLLGSPGSGKTSAIQSVSEGKALNSDVSSTDSVLNDKLKTTIGIDYAEIKIARDKNIKLIGTPGQIKFNFIWDIVCNGADAFIILLDMSRPEPLSYLKFYNDYLKNKLGVVLQIYCSLTHCDKYKNNINDFMILVENNFPEIMGVYRTDPREKNDISIMLGEMYLTILNNNK